MTEAVLGRSARKRATILEAGRTLFLRSGYQGTSMDQVAAMAEVSKQTVYKHFGDKQELLRAIVDDAVAGTVAPIVGRIAALADTDDLEPDLTALGSDYLRAVLQPPVVQLRRLIVAEANRLPELARQYHQQAPARTLAAWAEALGKLHDRGLLRVPDPDVAADQLAFLIVGRWIDQALFYGGPDVLADLDVERTVRAAVSVFLAAYRTPAR
ncbi:DNA-binding transcriptional regulator, AcrR family [Mycolicibacterium rutilum]|uniref:DNA-binding transcriptional regulator, AcrR family n=1 Tax=Mycolicibacterium rutilum TaxID=370526 RepID=A0A1H6JHY1_MYCRU|nr:TetR/AcrR family transcriptional regulator [Mycolicibacterium rutilum]SEH60038.1 DNA-binding transcriptional regulator, AcrR family [Mycolicibacterium rutilum]